MRNLVIVTNKDTAVLLTNEEISLPFLSEDAQTPKVTVSLLAMLINPQVTV